MAGGAGGTTFLDAGDGHAGGVGCRVDDAPPARPGEGRAGCGEDELAFAVGVVHAVFQYAAAEGSADRHADDADAGHVAHADEGVLGAGEFGGSVEHDVVAGADEVQAGLISHTGGGVLRVTRTGGGGGHGGAVGAACEGAAATGVVNRHGAAYVAHAVVELGTHQRLGGAEAGIDHADLDALTFGGVPGGGDVDVVVVPGQAATGGDGGPVGAVERLGGATAAGGGHGPHGHVLGPVAIGLEVAYVLEVAQQGERGFVGDAQDHQRQNRIILGYDLVAGVGLRAVAVELLQDAFDEGVVYGLPFGGVDVDLVDDRVHVVHRERLVADSHFAGDLGGAPEGAEVGPFPAEVVLAVEDLDDFVVGLGAGISRFGRGLLRILFHSQHGPVGGGFRLGVFLSGARGQQGAGQQQYEVGDLFHVRVWDCVGNKDSDFFNTCFRFGAGWFWRAFG